MEKKMNNLISQTEFKKSWAAKKATKTKRTEVGIDVLEEKKKFFKKTASPDTKADKTPEPKEDKKTNIETPEMKESLIEESLSLVDVSNNLKDLVFDADWDKQRKNIKVENVTDYQFDTEGNLILNLQLQPNNVVGNNITIKIGDSMENIHMYDNKNQIINGNIVANTKSWLFAVKDKLPKK